MDLKKVSVGLSALALCAILLESCAGSQKTASVSSNKDCNYAKAGAVTLNLNADKALQVSGNDLPRSYTVFTADNEKAFFAAAKKQGGTAAIQLPSGCRQFQLSLSETMSPQMMERYPDLISLKGISTDGTDLRLDWDGTHMRGQVLENGKSYLLEPRTARSGPVYILFDKADATTPRRSFEQSTPAGMEQLRRNQDVEK